VYICWTLVACVHAREAPGHVCCIVVCEWRRLVLTLLHLLRVGFDFDLLLYAWPPLDDRPHVQVHVQFATAPGEFACAGASRTVGV